MIYNSMTYVVFKGLKMIDILKKNLFKINVLPFYHLSYDCKSLINNVIFCKYFHCYRKVVKMVNLENDYEYFL